MKKLFAILMAILIATVVMLPAMAAHASSWGADVTADMSMYTLTVTRYQTSRDGTGALGYYSYDGKTVKAGDYVCYAVELKIPAHKLMIDRYGVDPGEDGAELHLKLEGLAPVTATGAASKSALVAALPAGKSVEHTVYFGPDGKWHDTAAGAIWTAAVTNDGKAAVTASVAYSMDVSKITLQYGAHDYKLAKDSSGYMAYDAETAMRFVTAKNGLVTSAFLAPDGKTWRKLYATRSGYAVEGDNAAGTWTAITSGYFAALGFNFNDIYSGDVYITPRNLLLHFGPPAEIFAVATWPVAPISAVTTLPISPAPAVPATGDIHYTQFFAGAAAILLAIAILLLPSSKGGKKL